MNNRHQSRYESSRMAFCGMVAGITVALMLAGSILPIASYAVPMFCSILLVGVMLEYGLRTALTTFAVAAILLVFVGLDREAAFFYLFFGYYPLLRPFLDRIRFHPLRFLCKLVFFNGSMALMLAFLAVVLHMDAVMKEFYEMSPVMTMGFVLLLNISMFLYDRLLDVFAILYCNKLRPRLRFLSRR